MTSRIIKQRLHGIHCCQAGIDNANNPRWHEDDNKPTNTCDNNTDDKKKDGDNEETLINRNDLEGLITKVEESNTPPSPPPSPPS